MKDLEKLGKECMTELDALRIPYNKHIVWAVNTRAVRKWGSCKKQDDRFRIEVVAALLQDKVSDTAAKNTIIHELLHTCPNCMTHGTSWQVMANRVNAAYPKYTIKRTTSYTEKGVVEDTSRYKYVCRCNRCGNTFYRARASAFTQNPNQYECRKCGAEDWFVAAQH